MAGQLLGIRLDAFGEHFRHIVAATLFVLHFAMEGESEENQNRDEAVHDDPKNGHRSPPNLSAMAGDYA
jgi:hypothetical protein